MTLCEAAGKSVCLPAVLVMKLTTSSMTSTKF